MPVRFLDAGECCLVVEFGDRIDVAVNVQVRALGLAVEGARIGGVQEAVPTYCSLAIYYDPLAIERDILKAHVESLLASAPGRPDEQPRMVEIPTVYGGVYGPDLDFVARYTGLAQDEVIRLHTEPLYHVFMLGFTAGFAYLGGLPERLSVPRLSTPRQRVPAGSVGIGGTQTGIYPRDSPGGWRIVGRTYVRLFDPSAEPPTLLLPGDKVRFVRIDETGYLQGVRAAAR